MVPKLWPSKQRLNEHKKSKVECSNIWDCKMQPLHRGIHVTLICFPNLLLQISNILLHPNYPSFTKKLFYCQSLTPSFNLRMSLYCYFVCPLLLLVWIFLKRDGKDKNLFLDFFYYSIVDCYSPLLIDLLLVNLFKT